MEIAIRSLDVLENSREGTAEMENFDTVHFPTSICASASLQISSLCVSVDIVSHVKYSLFVFFQSPNKGLN